jgi:putative peptidoglycan lipid II flippase
VARQRLIEAIDAVKPVSGYSLLTGIGLLLGFARELTVASSYGLSPQLDVFVAVTSLQLLFGTQLGNALEAAFISRVAKGSGELSVSRSLRSALYSLTIVNLGIVLFLLAGGEFLLRTVFPHFDEAQYSLAVRTLHLLLLPIVCASTAGLLRGALAVQGCFAPGFLTGSIVSACSILSVIFLSNRLGIDALTLGVAVGNVCVSLLFAAQLFGLTAPVSRQPMTPSHGGWFFVWYCVV